MNLEKKHSVKSPSKQLEKNYKHIRGWLSFFLVILGFGILFFSLKFLDYLVKTVRMFQIIYLSNNPLIIFPFVLYTILGFVTLGYSFYSFYCIIKLRSNAISLVRMVLLLDLIASFLTIILLYAQNSRILDNSNFQLYTYVVTFILSIIWFSYFSSSSRIKFTFPVQKRINKINDQIIFVLLLVLNVIYFIFSFYLLHIKRY